MSFDLKLRKTCDHRVYNEEHIVDADYITVYPKTPMINRDIVVKLNGYPIVSNQKIESYTIEDLTGYFTGTQNSFVLSRSIYDGLNLRQLANNKNSVVVQLKVTDENNSFQFTGVENWFITQHIPLLTEFNFSGNLSPSDVTVKVNGNAVDVTDIDSITGRITLRDYPLSTDLITVSYFFKAKVKSINALSGVVIIEEYPTATQQVLVKYFSLQDNGWKLKDGNIVFDKNRKTNRLFVLDENVSSQFDGENKVIKTTNYPLMPAYNFDLHTQPLQTLPNSVQVKINGDDESVEYVDPIKGFVFLFKAPLKTDIVTISYFYQDESTPDIIILEYQTGIETCPKCMWLGYVDDFEFDPTGNFITVENEEKLVQDVRKLISTVKGSNTEHVWYGSNLENLIGYTLLPDFVKAQISTEIQNALRDLKEMQVKQSEYQEVTTREFINSIRNLNVIQDTSDPTYWKVETEIITQARTNAELIETIQFESK
jgi:phage baseplate assembly protein W